MRIKNKFNNKYQIQLLKLLCNMLIVENNALKNQIVRIIDKDIDDSNTFLNQIIKK